MDNLEIIDGERVKRLRKKRGWTQVRLALKIGAVGVGWVRKIEAGKPVRLEWNGDGGAVKAGEYLAAALDVELDTLILDLLEGDKIKQFREQRNWTPEHLADSAHVDADVVKRAETGQYVLRVETRAIAEAFDVPAWELLFKEQKVKKLKFDRAESGQYMRGALVGLCMINRKRAAHLKQTPNDTDFLEDAHGRIQFVLWKMGKDAAIESSPTRPNTPYVLAIEMAIGSEFASRTCPGPDRDIVVRAKEVAAGHDEEILAGFSTCEQLTAQYLSCWITQKDLAIDWDAPDADLAKLCAAGLAGLAMAINAVRYSASEKHAQASADEAGARLDFLTAFISRYHRQFPKLLSDEHAEFIRLMMLLVLGSQMAGFGGKRLSFVDTVEIEEAARETLSWILSNTSERSG